MRTINPVKAGLATGIVLGLWHLTWAVLVALTWAQPVMDFVLRIHFIQPFLHIQAFDLATAASLVFVTALVGFVIGAVLALAWNQLHSANPSTGAAARRA
jgi:thiamine transporter ThiT